MNPEKPEPDAEQLLKMLDLQIAQKRSERARHDAGRGAYRIVSIVLIIGIALIALFALQMFLSQMQRPDDRVRGGSTQADRP
jgi:hypothetical protein